MIKPKNLSAPNTSIVIPVYKNSEFLRKNLPKVIDASRYKKNNIIEIIVVDDATPDNGNDFVKKEYKNIRFIKHSIMRGYSASVNTGARSSKGKLLALLSCDASPSKDFVSEVYKNFENPGVFSVALKEVGYSWERGFFKDGYVGHDGGAASSRDHETFYVSTAAGVFRRDYWMKLGGLDEKVLSPSYWEDIDLSYRAAKRGFLNYWNPKAKVNFGSVKGSGGTEVKNVQKVRERNKLLFHWKNITSRNIFRKHILGLAARLVKHPFYIEVLWNALKRIKLVLKARKKEMKEAKISDEAIFSKFKND